MDKKIIELLEDIKKLMILNLIERDVQGKRIAEVLGVDPAIVSRLISVKRSRKK
jgi:predicted transcriptional regulator